MARTVTMDFRRGGGSPAEVLYGEVTLEPTAYHNTGTATVLPEATKVSLVNGQASLPNVESSPSGLTPAWVYLVTVRAYTSSKAWSFLVGVPDGTAPIAFKDLAKFTTPGSGVQIVGGKDGESAYQTAVDNGFVGTAAQWLASLVGPQGVPGPNTVPTDSATAANVNSTSSLTDAALKAKYVRAVIAVGPGIDPTGAADSTAAVQVLANKAQATDGELVFPAGTFKVELASVQSFAQARIRGMGMKVTTLITKGTGPAIKMVGGSGQASGGVISDMTIKPTGTTGVELQGTVGVTLRNVRFDGAGVGLLFHNFKSGDFTEFCVAENCYFEEGLTQKVEYRRVSGRDSFHGSGLRGCVLNQSATDTSETVKIGAGCLVYNAPMDATFFGRVLGLAFIRNDGLNCTLHGHIKFESILAMPIVALNSGKPVYFGGSVTVLGGAVQRGTMFRQVHDVAINADSSVSANYSPYMRKYGLTTGLNITDFALQSGETALASVLIIGANYEQERLVSVTINPTNGDQGSVVTITTGRDFNSSGWGAPVFGITTGGRLTITNANYPASGVTATVRVHSQLGRIQSPLT